MRKRKYPSDISREQFEQIRPLLESMRKKTKPRMVDLYDRCAANLSHVQSVLADGGYVGQPVAQAVKDKLGATVQIAKRNELHAFAVILQRWVVERSFARLEKCRHLWKNCERKLNTSVQFVHLAFLVLLIRRY